MYFSCTRNILCVLFIVVHKLGALIYLVNAVTIEIIRIMKYRCYILLSLDSAAFTKIGRFKPLYEVVECH